MSSITDNADNASSSVEEIGSSAQKAAKDMKNLASFDTANILQSNSDNSSSSESGGTVGNAGLNFGSSLSDTIQKAYELINLFKQGFSEGIGVLDFSDLIDSIKSIKNNLIDVFTSPEVLNSANNLVNTAILNFGKVLGSAANIGVTIADNLIGGVNLFLEQNKQSIQDHIVKLFDISSRRSELLGNIAVATADIFSVFRGDTAKQITADIIAIFTEGILGSIEVIGTLANDILYIITQPFIDNKDLIKQTLEGMLEPISSVLSTIKQGVQDTFSKFWEVYDLYISPAVENIKNGFSSILETILPVWNENIKPILDEWAAKFDVLWKEHLQPMVNSFLEFIGKLISAISELWTTWIVPIINWIVENVVPVLVPIFETLGNIIGVVIGTVIDILKGLWDALGGLIDFIVGVFTGDWDQAWQGICDFFIGIWNAIKSFFVGIWDAIKGIVQLAIDTISAVIQTVLNVISSIWNAIWNSIGSVISSVWNAITNTVGDVINGIKNTISNVLNTISTIWSNIWNGIKNTVTNIWNGIWGTIKSVINSILGGIESFVNGVISGINFVLGGISDVANAVGSLIGLDPINLRLNTISLPRLAEGGYAKANTPQLAIVGDNKTQGEIIAPEDKILDLYKQANKELGTGNNEKIIRLLNKIIQLLELLSNQDFHLYLDGYELDKRLEKIRNKRKFARNGG